MTALVHKLLDERGWLPIYLASSAAMALADGNAREAAKYIVDLHALDESRQKAVSIALLRPMLDRLIEEGATVTHAELDRLEAEYGGLVVKLPPGATGARLYGPLGDFIGDMHVIPASRAGSWRKWLSWAGRRLGYSVP